MGHHSQASRAAAHKGKAQASKLHHAVGAKVRDQYSAKNPLIASFYQQAKDL